MPHILIELFLYQGFSRFKAICLPSNRKSPFVDVDSVPGSLFEVGDVKLPLFDLSRSFTYSSQIVFLIIFGQSFEIQVHSGKT